MLHKTSSLCNQQAQPTPRLPEDGQIKTRLNPPPALHQCLQTYPTYRRKGHQCKPPPTNPTTVPEKPAPREKNRLCNAKYPIMAMWPSYTCNPQPLQQHYSSHRPLPTTQPSHCNTTPHIPNQQPTAYWEWANATPPPTPNCHP